MKMKRPITGSIPPRPRASTRWRALVATFVIAVVIAVTVGLYVVLAADQFWNTNGTSNTWTATNWGTSAAGPFTNGWTANNVANFTANSAITYVSTTNVGGITVINSSLVTLTPAGTFTTNGAIRTFDVGSGSTLDFGTQNMSTAAGTGLIKSGAGIYFNQPTNGFPGGFTLNNGTVVLGGVNAMGSGGPLTINGGALGANASRTFTAKFSSFTVGGDFTMGAVTTSLPAAENATNSANISIDTNASLGAATRTITIGSNATYTLGGILSGTSGTGITVANGAGATGTLVLSGANNYTGDTTISAGKLSLGTTGSIANSPAIILAGGSSFDVSTLATPLTLASGQALKGSGTSTTGTIVTASGKGLTTATNSPLQFTAFNGSTPPLSLSGAGTLALQSTNPVTVNITNGGTPLGAGDYKLIAKGTGSVTGTPTSVTVTGDGIASGAGASLVNTGNELFLHVSSVLNVTTDPTGNEGNAGTTTATFTVTLTPASAGTVTVHYSTQDNTATTGDSDYAGISDTVLTFNPGDTSKNINVTINGDTKFEPTEQFFFNINTPSGANISDNQGIGTITNDDSAPLLNVTNDPSVVEGNAGTTPATFNVTISNPTYQTVTVHYSTQDSSATVADNDYTAIPDTVLTFNPGEVSKNIDVLVKGDINVEPNEQFFFNINNPLNANISDNQGIGTITADDFQLNVTNNPSVTEGNSGTIAATFNVTLTPASTNTVTVHYSTQDDTATVADNDYTAISDTVLTFDPGDTSKNIDVLVKGDTNVEPNEQFFFNINTPVGANISDNQGIGTITNDDVASDTDVSVTGGNLILTDGNGGTTADTLTLSLNGSNVRINDPNHTVGCSGGTPVDANTCDVPLSSITGNIQVNTLGGNDTLTLNFAGGNFMPPGGLNYDGGSQTSTPGDKLVITGGNQGTVTYNYTNAHDGSVAMQNFGTVSYIGLEPISNSGTASDIIFNLPAGPNIATLADDGPSGNTLSRLSAATIETTDFANPTGSLTINRGNASDTLAVNALPDFNAGLTIGSGANPFSTITFSGAVTLAANKNLSGDASNTISLPGAAADLATSGTGTATLTTARNISLSTGSSIAVVNGALTLNANTAGTTNGNFVGINLTAATLTTSGAGNISLTGKGGIDAPTPAHFGIRSTNSTISSTSAAAGAGTIMLDGTGGTGSTQNRGVQFDNGAGATSIRGDISITGHGGISSSNNQMGVLIGLGSSVVSTGAAKITIDGTGGSGTSSNTGARVSDQFSKVTSAGGDIKIIGHGGPGTTTGNHGVSIAFGALVSATGGAKITLDGTAGGGTNSSTGVIVAQVDTDAAKVTSDSGDILITGVGGTGTGNGNIGANILQAGSVVATGAANITINGTGGSCSAGADCYGVDFESGGVAGTAVTSVNGNINVTGTSTAATGLRQNGIRFEDSATAIAFTMATTGAGSVTLTGTAGNHDQTSAGIAFADDTALSSTGASNAFIADTMDIVNSDVSINMGANTLALRQKTAGTLIDLGSATDISANTLELSDVELDLITCGTLNIGNSNSGAMTITAPITRAAATVMNLTSGANIFFSTGSLNSAGGDVTLVPGSNVYPFTSGVDVTTSATKTLKLTSGTDLKIDINSTTFDSGYTQLHVAGLVDLNNANLMLGGSYVPVGGESFTIVENDGSDAISGTFASLPEGATIPSFLGSGLNATITYVGGSGNDAVLTVQPAPSPGAIQFSTAGYLVSEGGTNALITFKRVGGTAGPVSATFQTSNGSATSPGDYTPVSQSVSWADGDASDQTVNVPIINDGIAEGYETVHLALSNPQGGATLGAPSLATLTITDNDSANTVIVNTLDDQDFGACLASPGHCSLREAVKYAPAGSHVTFAVTGTIFIVNGELSVNKNLNIDGPGASLVTVDGSNASRVFVFLSGNTDTVSGLTIAHANGNGNGGGISNTANLTVTDCVLSTNHADAFGGGIVNLSPGTLTVNSSTLTANSASPSGGASGGGIASFGGTVTVNNSTFFGNTTRTNGAGIWSSNTTLSINSSTFNGNSGGFCDGFGCAGTGGGVSINSGTATINNTIISGNSSQGGGADLSGTVDSGDYNLILVAGGSFTTGGTHNITGSDPLLGPLQNNGGPTPTMALPLNSPAIDQGLSGSLTTDQRGGPRPADLPATPNASGGDGADIGAFEYDVAQVGTTLVVNTADDIDDGLCTVGHCSLREAINAANANVDANTITFDIPGGPTQNITLQSALPVITQSVTIQGPTDDHVAIDGAYTNRVFDISTAPVVNISYLTIANGQGGVGSGGGLWNEGTGSVTVVNSTFTGNESGFPGGGGGGAANTGGGTLSLTNSTFQGNTTRGDGGAILNSSGTTNLLNVTVAENAAVNFSGTPHGGGVAQTGGTINVKNTLVAGNSSEGTGPDIFGSLTSQGHNLIGMSDGGSGFTNGTNGDQVGTVASPIDPRLNLLSDYGGPTPTMELLPGSPALEAGDNTGAPATDQRGVTRPQGNNVDIGAFELQAIVVTKTADTNNTCLPGDCSLREAINAANSEPYSQMIVFNITGDAGCDINGVCTINPSGSSLPTVQDTVFIDGYSQPGAKLNDLNFGDGDNAVLKIQLSGTGLPSGSLGIDLHYGADWSAVRGLIINNFDGAGVWVENYGPTQVSGNFIGTNASGTAAAANGDGVTIINGEDHLIGGDLPAERNIISGNRTNGVKISSDEANYNSVEGNFIGTTKNGDAALPNVVGVYVNDDSEDNTIGCEVPNGDNLISGNTSAGVRIEESAYNTVEGNFIGTDRTGTTAIANDTGVHLKDSGINDVGLPDFGNLISGNVNAGILIETTPSGSSPSFNNVEGNRIGTNLLGAGAIANKVGIVIHDSSYNTIGGGNVSGDRNYISGNTFEGILIEVSGPLATSGSNSIFGNSIGANVAGTGSIPNGGSGVKIIGGYFNEVGCTFTGSGNLISGNSGEGVELTGGAGNNFVQGNLIGVKADASAGLANGGSGVEIYSTMSQPSTDNVVGVLPDIDEERARHDKFATRAGQNGIAPKTGPCRTLPERNTLRESKAKVLSQARLARQKTDGTRANGEAPKRATGVKLKRRSLIAKLPPRSRFTALAEASSSVKGATRVGPSFTPPPTVTVNGGNLIAYNLEDGVKISSSGDVNNLISQNSIYLNGLLGINLVGGTETAEVTDNDPGDGDDGPNHLQNFPAITDAAADTQTIYGILDSSAGDGPFTIEFFANDNCDGSGNGEGKTWIGSTQSGVGNFNFTANPSSFIAGQTITATATDSYGNTSEFSSCFIASVTTAGADLYIEKTDSPDPVTVGGTLTYTITVFSNGPADAHSVQVTDTLPPGVTWVSSTPSTGSCSGTSTVTCNLGTVSYGQTPTVQIVVTAPGTPGSISNSAFVESPDDTVTENNSASADTQVSAACPTYFTVNDNGDASDATPGDSICATAGAVCTLRAAIEEANALSSCGTIDINFSGVTGSINLGTVLPSINHNVNINGPGANVLTVQRSSASAFRVFTISSGKTVSLNDLTISNGSASIGGGIYNNRGTLAVRYCTVSGNSASTFGGGIHNGGIGAGNADLAILNSTISGNSSAGDGGGVYSDAGAGTATLTMINSTVSGNTANNHVGGVYVISSPATLTNVTITNNRADNDNIAGGAAGGLSESGGTVTLHNTIVAGNFRGGSPSTTRDDINGSMQAASSYNLIGDGSGMSGISNVLNNNQVGSAGSPINPLLGALQNNGGPTFTHGLLYNSPAVDKGDDAVIGPPLQLGTDQRGLPRQDDGDLTAGAVVDIGAYERQSTESRTVPDGANIQVNLVDAILTFPCIPNGACGGGVTRKDDAKTAAPLRPAGPPTASITVIDPAGQPSPPIGYAVGNTFNPPLPAFDLSTTASFDTPINVCFYLPSITDPSFFTGLKILHYEGAALVDRTTGQNFASKLVCASVNSLSPFVVGHTVTPTAANGNVSGQILDSNGHPVEGAGIRMSGTQTRLTVTDANGNYRFDNVETNGFYTVVPSRANYSFSPAQRSFSALGQQTEAVFSAATNGTALNPLDTTEYFIRQQYLDFLGREPDEAGLNFWYQNIESCGDGASCRAAKRIDTSAAFFLSIEFQQTGYLVYRTYQAAYGDMPGAPVPLRLGEFKPDSATISNGVVVNKTGWETQLDTNKQAYMQTFVQRPRFTGAFPATMTPAEFVDSLFVNAGVSPSTDARLDAIAEFGSAATSSDLAARGRALRRVAENAVLARQEFSQAFVLMQYFGYLRRDANAAPDTDFSGYNFWLNKLNRFQGNFGDAEMVKAFLLSGEYRGRFPR